MKTNNKIIAILMVIVIALSACSPAITKETAEKELVSFILDNVFNLGVCGADIIIWYPPVGNWNWTSYWLTPSEYINRDKPIKVWLNADNKYVEATDMKATIQNYKQSHMMFPDQVVWGYAEFGIMSISSNNQKATIYVGATCGPLTGKGGFFDLKRNNSGKWEIKDSNWVWIS